MPMVFSSTLTLLTFVFFFFTSFQVYVLPLGVSVRFRLALG